MVVDETDVPVISVGDSAVVELDAFSGQSFAAQVSSIGNSAIQSGSGGASQGSVTFEVILTLLDRPENLRPDLSATADIIVDQRKQVMAVPIISVILEPETGPTPAPGAVNEAEASNPGPASRPQNVRSEGVFVVRDGRAVWTPITVGITGQEYFEILSGLLRGDQVVSGPYQTIRALRDGDEVQSTSGTSGPL
jgi:HlyD family secretion protein